MPWLNTQCGRDRFQDIQKATVADALDHREDYPEDMQRMLVIRQQLGKTSIKRCGHGYGKRRGDRVRGLTQYYGANRTGRWAGRMVQMQNLPELSEDPGLCKGSGKG